MEMIRNKRIMTYSVYNQYLFLDLSYDQMFTALLIVSLTKVGFMICSKNINHQPWWTPSCDSLNYTKNKWSQGN